MTPLLRYFFLVKGFLVKPLRLQIVTSKETTNTQTAYLKSSTNNPAGISVNSTMTIQKASGCLIFREIFLLRGSRWERKNIVLELHPSAFDKKSPPKKPSQAFVFVFRKHF